MITKHIIFIESLLFSAGYEMCRYAKEIGLEITLICRDIELYLDGTPLSEHPLGLADHLIQIETNDPNTLIAFLEDYGKEKPFHGIHSFADYYVEIAARVANHFGLPTASPLSVSIAKNKDMTREYLRNWGVPSPSYYIAENAQEALLAADQIGYPCIVKPTAENGSYAVNCVHNEKELMDAFSLVHGYRMNARQQSRTGKVLIEEYMQGEEISVETISLNGKCHVIGVTSKGLCAFPYFVELEISFPHILDKSLHEAAVATVISALDAIGLTHGPCHTEIKLTKDGPKIVEINPRLGGSYLNTLINEAIGINMMKEIIKLAVNEPINIQPCKHGGAAFAPLYSPVSGIVKDIDLSLAAQIPQVLFTELSVNPGDSVARSTSNYDSFGYICTIGDNAKEAMKTLHEALSKVKITLEQNQEVVPYGVI